MLPAPIATPARRWLLAALLGTVLAPAARAADLDKLDVPSLKEIPADAAFYSTSLRIKEQIDIVANSKAWKKLVGLPGVQFGWQMLRNQMNKPGGPLEKYEEFVKEPENKQLVELLGDMFSHEVYTYGGANASDVTQLVTELFAAFQYGPLLIQLSGNPKNLDQSHMQAAAVFNALANNIDLIKSPDMVVGFKLSKTEPAEAQLKRLEKLLQQVAEQKEELKGRVKRVKAAGGDFLTITLDGKMLPLDDFLMPLKEYEEKPGQYEAVVKKLKALKLTIGLGIRKGYLLYTVGESTAHLEKLGAGKKLLDQAELKPLAKYADQRLISIGYLSKELHAKLAPNKRDLYNYLNLANSWIPKADLTDEQKARLKKDLANFVKVAEKHLPEVGAQTSFGFITARGTEGFVYDWSQNPSADASKPLTLLNHVGGDPLIAVVARGKSSPNDYAEMVQWLKVIYGWAEELALPKLPDDQKDKYKQVFKAIQPLLKRLDEATGKMLVPALADGQAGFVLDAKLTSKQWFPAMPPAAKPLPMLEPALLVGVSDPDLLVKAFTEYRSIANDLAKEVRKIKEEAGEFEIPPPKMSKIKGGTMYAYPLPAHWGVEKLLPNAAVGAKLAVVTVSEEHSVRLLTATPLKTDGGPLANPQQKLSAASYVSWAGLIDTIVPWVEYGVDMAPGTGVLNKDDILKQVKGAFESLKAFRSSTSATYEEGGATVTHSETIIRDLP
jgi:hypothetical protein